MGSVLRGRSPYDMRPGAVSLAPFKLASLSLPDNVAGCPTLGELLPPTALSLLEGYQERMLAPDGAKSEITEFLDPTLRHNAKKYHRLVQTLHARGLVTMRRACRERVGLFALWKERS